MAIDVSPYTGLAFWLFVPSMITDFLLARYYGFRYGSSRSRPQQNTSKYTKDRNRIYIFVVTLYLLYSFVNTIQSLPPNHYSVFDLSPSADSRELRSAHRKLSLIYHPDKNPGDEVAQNKFIQIRKTYEVLSDTLKRSVYDTLGLETIKNCNRCLNYSDYLSSYITNSFAPFYIFSGLVLVLLQFLEVGQFGRYWRFTTFVGMGVLELFLIVRPNDSSTFISQFLNLVSPHLTTTERITLLHQNFAIIFIALSQIGPLLFPVKKVKLEPLVAQAEAFTKLLGSLSANELNRVFEPFKHEEGLKNEIKKRMEKQLLEEQLVNDKEYLEAVTSAKRRVLKKK